MKNSIKYSQNFIKSPGLIAKLLGKSTITSADTVCEVGAGTGVITAKLAEHSKQVLAFEADGRLAANLRQKFATAENVKLIEGDFLKQELPASPYKVFSNIPFNITADIVRKLVEAASPPEDAYLFVQKEAAKKLVGQPFARQETQFSVLTKPWFELSVVHHFDKNDFQPAPAVEVVLLQIRKLAEPVVETGQKQLYRDFIVYAFNAKKPTLKKALEGILTHNQFKRLAKDLHFDLKATPTELSFEQWLGLFRYFLVGAIEEKRRLVAGAEAELKLQQMKLDKVHRTSTARQG